MNDTIIAVSIAIIGGILIIVVLLWARKDIKKDNSKKKRKVDTLNYLKSLR